MPKKAILNYTKALSIKPNAESYYRRALSYLGINNLKEAIADANKSLALKKNYSAYLVLGHALLYSKKPKEALKASNESLEMFPIQRTVFNVLNKNKFSGELKNLLKNQQQNDLSEIYFLKALIHMDLDDEQNSFKFMKKAASLGNLEAKNLVKILNLNN